jgi:hypothetical protein
MKLLTAQLGITVIARQIGLSMFFLSFKSYYQMDKGVMLGWQACGRQKLLQKHMETSK